MKQYTVVLKDGTAVGETDSISEADKVKNEAHRRHGFAVIVGENCRIKTVAEAVAYYNANADAIEGHIARTA